MWKFVDSLQGGGGTRQLASTAEGGGCQEHCSGSMPCCFVWSLSQEGNFCKGPSTSPERQEPIEEGKLSLTALSKRALCPVKPDTRILKIREFMTLAPYVPKYVQIRRIRP